MGRLTQAARASFQDYLQRMRTEYKEALVSKGRREAFDRLVEAWSSELGTISYAESLSLMDLILLTGEVDNRAFLEALRLKLDDLDHRLNEAEYSRNALEKPWCPYLFKPYKPYCSKCGRCAGRNPPSVLSGIRLYGLPAPPAGGYRRLFALSPCGSAVSAQPPGVLAPDRGSQHLPGEVSFLSGADALASRLAASQPCSVDGVSSDPLGGPAAAHRLTDRETNEDGGV